MKFDNLKVGQRVLTDGGGYTLEAGQERGEIVAVLRSGRGYTVKLDGYSAPLTFINDEILAVLPREMSSVKVGDKVKINNLFAIRAGEYVLTQDAVTTVLKLDGDDDYLPGIYVERTKNYNDTRNIGSYRINGKEGFFIDVSEYHALEIVEDVERNG